MRMNIRESGYEGKREIERGYKFTTCALRYMVIFFFFVLVVIFFILF